MLKLSIIETTASIATILFTESFRGGGAKKIVGAEGV